MHMDDLITRIISGEVSPLPAASEGDWYREWTGHNLHLVDTLTMAAWGGALADRLAWVFVSGYQAAIRAAFYVDPVPGWLALLVSEDRDEPSQQVTVGLGTSGGVLQGVKTWVAACDHVDTLLVKAGRRPSVKLMEVAAGAPGVELTARSAPGFLPDLSQGKALFDGVVINPEHTLDPAALGRFGAGEALHVTIAVAGYMLSHICRFHVTDSGEQGTRGMIRQLASSLVAASDAQAIHPDSAETSGLLAQLDRDIQTLVPRFEALLSDNDADAAQRWQRDQRLVSMYSSSIQTGSAAA
jgi:hypothetical protein